MLLGIGVYRLSFFRFKYVCLLQASKSREKKTWAVRAAITVPHNPAPRGAAPWLVHPEAAPRVLVWVGAQLHDSCTGPVDSQALLGVTLTEVPRALCSWVKFVLEVETVQGVSLACGLLKDGLEKEAQAAGTCKAGGAETGGGLLVCTRAEGPLGL